MRIAKTLMLASAMAASMVFSCGVSSAAPADAYPYCQLISPQALNEPSASVKDLFAKTTNADEITDKLLDPVAPLSPDKLESIYKQVFDFIGANYIDASKLDRLDAYQHKYDGKLKTREDLDHALADLISVMNDRWTWISTASQQVEQFMQYKSKQVDFGIGLRARADGSFFIERIDYGSGAQLAGFHEGDSVISVGGKQLKGMSKADAEKLFVGPVGNSIEIASVQDGKSVDSTYTLRAPAPNKASADLLKNNLAYVKLPSFMNDQDFAKLVGSLTTMAQSTPGGLQGAILDLRFNGGGQVTMAKTLISLLLAQGTAIHETTRDGRTLVETTTSILPEGAYGKLKFNAEELAVLKELQTIPLVILVNGSTASAAEIVTGSLMESRPNTTVIGERTFGKFEEMLVTTLPNCAEVAVTSARYTTPSGKWLHNKGITPEITVEQPRDSQDDAQMAAAIKLLSAKTGLNPANIVSMPPAAQQLLQLPVPARPDVPVPSTNWKQFLTDYHSQIMQGGVGVVLLGLFGFFLLLTGKKKND